jgi:hypothetical protein
MMLIGLNWAVIMSSGSNKPSGSVTREIIIWAVQLVSYEKTTQEEPYEHRLLLHEGECIYVNRFVSLSVEGASNPRSLGGRSHSAPIVLEDVEIKQRACRAGCINSSGRDVQWLSAQFLS